MVYVVRAIYGKLSPAAALPKMPDYRRKTGCNQRLKLDSPGQGSDSHDSGILNEQILVLVFESLKWDIHTLCHTASTSRKLRALANRLLWRELCAYRAPRMVAALVNGGPNNRIGGGWQALAKLLFFCSGCESTQHFVVSQPSRGHFVAASRFSKTSGWSFLTKKCRGGDLLYVSDPCEHSKASDRVDDLGVYRGVFQGFMKSRTRACLVARQVALEETVRCPYCGARVWSMTTAKLVPKSAARRLGSHEGKVEFFVCVNGHLFGSCWLIALSSDEAGTDGDDDGDDSDVDDGGGGGGSGPSSYGVADGLRFGDHTVCNGSNKSFGKGIEDGPAA